MPHKYHGPESPNPVQGHGLKVLVDTTNVAYPGISNDFYHDREDEFPLAVKDLRVPFMIVDGQVVLEQERLRKAMQIADDHLNDSQHCHHAEHRHRRHGQHPWHERNERGEHHQSEQREAGHRQMGAG